MVATLAQAASAEYYLESQRSFRHPNEYYTAGEEPDGVWFNPGGLLGLENGGKVDSGDFHRLYHGFAPDSSSKLTRNAGSEQRSPGVDMTFSADKSVSALWAIADPELRSEIEQAHNDAARVALEETVFRYCAYTRIRDREGRIRVLPADISVAMFQHGTSRENDPQLHTHCVIFNAARTHEDGKWRAMHQYPVYSWAKGRGRGLPQCPGLEPPREPRCPHGAVRSRWRAHPYRGHAGGPAGLLVEATEGDRGQGRRAGHSLSRQRLAHGGGQQTDAGRQIA